MVVKRHEERGWSGKHRRWHESRRIVWKSDVRDIGAWHLDDSVIEHANFASFAPRPAMTMNRRPAGSRNCWFSDYVTLKDDSSRRFAYEVTPIPTEPVTLIAAVSSAPGVLTAFTDARALDRGARRIRHGGRVDRGCPAGAEALSSACGNGRLHGRDFLVRLAVQPHHPPSFGTLWQGPDGCRRSVAGHLRDRALRRRVLALSGRRRDVGGIDRGGDLFALVLFIWSEGRGVRRSSFE